MTNGHTGRNAAQCKNPHRPGFHNAGRPSHKRSPDRKVQRSPDRRQRTPDRTRDRTPERRHRTPERLRRQTPPSINYQLSSHHTTRQQQSRGFATASTAPRPNVATTCDHVYQVGTMVPWKDTTRQQQPRGSATATAAPKSNGAANYDHVYNSNSVVPWKAQ
jgi:hypothetical protein